jgi:hypothetical protein
MKKILTITLILIISTAAFAQKADTVVVELARTSRMVFTIRDKSDLEQLKQYDFQAMFDDILARLEKNDSVIVVVDQPAEEPAADVTENTETWAARDFNAYRDDDHGDDTDDNDKDDEDERYYNRRIKHRGTTHAFNIDLGLNSYLEDGKFPDEEGQPYAMRPWGSWYVGLSSVQRTGFGRHFHLEWALGVSWYNFKFQNDNTLVVKDDTGVSFEEDLRDVSFIKSKLGVTYLNASAVPMFTIGGYRSGRKWRSYNTGFRIGAGPYIGYRIGSSTKLVYKDDGDRQRTRERDNFYLNNLRYGIRLQLGVRSADFFFSYDMNELFATGKGPKLNAFSFGITL